jgi:tetraether lipid synthase
MSCCEEQVLSETESVCPECLARIPATHVARGDDVYLKKTCPEHGGFDTVIWRGPPAYASWVRPKLPSYPDNPFTPVDRGCPFDCGLCPDHRQQSCCVLFEVTQRCDLRCPVCFANAGNQPTSDPDLHIIEGWYRRLLEAGGPFNIQLSGGEPCLRDDLPDIIALGRSLGFSFFQVNTNGLRLSGDADYLKRLKGAGLATVFLQFDGMCDCIHEKLRGRPLAAQKQAAIERCAEMQVGVVLVPTLVPGVNVDDIGGIIEFGVRYSPTVRGVHFQPISYFGRYPRPPCDAARITIPEIIRAIETQTQGAIKGESFCPPGGENALCSFHGNFVLMPEGKLLPLTRHYMVQHASEKSCCGPTPAKEGAAKSREFVARKWSLTENVIEVRPAGEPSLGEWDEFLARAQTHTFCISGMAFQDAWTLDLERLRDCYIHIASPDGRLIPFCAYNLTDQSGYPLYRPLPVPSHSTSS